MPSRRSPRLIQATLAKSVRSLLSSLPLELHQMICSHLSQHDLVSLLKTDSNIYEATLPFLFKTGTLYLRPSRYCEIKGDGRPFHPPFLHSWSQIQKIDLFIIVAGFGLDICDSEDLSFVHQIGRNLRPWPGTCNVTLQTCSSHAVLNADSKIMRALRGLDGFKKVVIHIPRIHDARTRYSSLDLLVVEENLRGFLGRGRFCDKETTSTKMALKYDSEDVSWRRDSGSLDDEMAHEAFNGIDRFSMYLSRRRNARGKFTEPTYVEFYPLDYSEKKKSLQQNKTVKS